MKNSFLSFFLFCLLLAICLPLFSFEIKHGPANFANLVYSALDHFPLEGGSFEIRFRPGFNPDLEPKVSFYMPMTYLSVSQAGGRHLLGIISRQSWNANLQRGGSDFVLTGSMLPGGSIALSHDSLGLQRGQWHDLIVSWQPEHGHCLWQIWFDGKLVRESKEKMEGKFLLDEENKMYVGSRYFNCCYAAVDWMRLSWGRRTPETFAPVADRQTMLLEQFQPGKFIGQLEGSHRFVNTTDGRQTLELFVVEEED